MDIKSAFLRGVKINEDIYMKTPDGSKESHNINLVNKAFYGLKQVYHFWNTKFITFETQKLHNNITYLLLCVYNIIVAENNILVQEVIWLKSELTKTFGELVQVETKVIGNLLVATYSKCLSVQCVGALENKVE